MPQPYDYSQLVGGFQSPQEAFVDALKMRQLYEQEQAKAKEQADQKAYLADLQKTMQKPSAENWQALYAKYPMQYEQIAKIRQGTSPAKSNLFTATGVKLLQLDQAGDTEGVNNLLNETANAIANGVAAGTIDQDTVQQFNDMRQSYGKITDPTARRGTIAGLLAVYADKDQFDRVSKVLGLDLPAPIAEYQARVRKDGKESADQWWELESSKVVTTDDQVVDVSEFLRGKRSVTGKPAPKGVTFTPIENGGQTGSAPSGSFQGQ